MKDYSGKFTETRNVINDMLKKSDDDFIRDFLNICDYKMFFMFCFELNGDVKKLRRYLRKSEIAVEI